MLHHAEPRHAVDVLAQSAQALPVVTVERVEDSSAAWIGDRFENVQKVG